MCFLSFEILQAGFVSRNAEVRIIEIEMGISVWEVAVKKGYTLTPPA